MSKRVSCRRSSSIRAMVGACSMFSLQKAWGEEEGPPPWAPPAALLLPVMCVFLGGEGGLGSVGSVCEWRGGETKGWGGGGRLRLCVRMDG